MSSSIPNSYTMADIKKNVILYYSPAGEGIIIFLSTDFQKATISQLKMALDSIPIWSSRTRTILQENRLQL